MAKIINDIVLNNKAGENKPTYREVEDLRSALKGFHQKVMNGVIVSTFDQFLISQNIRKLSDDGMLSVYSDRCSEDYQYCRINASLELWDYFKDEDTFRQFPEERKLFHEKIFNKNKKIKADIATMLASKKI